MSKKSAGLLVYRFTEEQPQVLLVHPGGPFYVKKDEGVWSVPKGEYGESEEPQAVAMREFEEETGNSLRPGTSLFPLEPVKIKSGKEIQVWAAEADFPAPYISSNTFEIEWPPHSGRKQEFPEADKAEWFDFERALLKIHPGQAPILLQVKGILQNRIRA
ncbi:NUDIX domain-containing protein [Arcticibacter sp. MXS-1]|uniref:NUDIX domain-containing protein n=1 Tax=Arcticibacter sp. MXS-1 TaxID=3341726 RepID=UPI0035A91393